MTHHYFRVYPNGDRAKALQLTTEEKDELVAYNEVMRFGCAQFVRREVRVRRVRTEANH